MKTRRRAAKDGETSMGAGAHFEASAAMVVSPVAALEKYRRHVAHLDLSETAKTELLQAVWQIMGSFVDRAFGDDPVQQVIRPVDQIPSADSADGGVVIGSSPNQTNHQIEDLPAAFTHVSDGGSGKVRP